VQNGTEDEDVPSHLYGRLPKHAMVKDEQGREVPDYLKMILMCESCCPLRHDCSRSAVDAWAVQAADLLSTQTESAQLIPSAKTYAAPLSLKETPLTLAANLSARFGCEVSQTLDRPKLICRSGSSGKTCIRFFLSRFEGHTI
jgi:threonine dehydratase